MKALRLLVLGAVALAAAFFGGGPSLELDHLAGVDIASAQASVIATVPVGSMPWGIEANAAGTRVYAADWNGGTISIIDAASNTVTSTIPLTDASGVVSVALNEGAGRYYAGGGNNHVVYVLDTASNAILTTIPIPGYAMGLGFNPATNRLYAARWAGYGLSVIDTTTNSVVADMGTGIDPRFVAVNASTNRIYVTNEGSGNVTVIDGATNGVITNIPIGTSPWGLDVNTATNRIYVANTLSDSVSVIDGATNSVLTTITVGAGPRSVAVDSARNRIYVANREAASLSIIDGATNSVVDTVSLGTGAYDVAVIQSLARAYTTNQTADAVSVVQDEISGGDADGDGVPDASDNCPSVPNPEQTNTDGDALGDACDPDDDNDTVGDGADNCPLASNPSQTNTDGDAMGDACDPDDDNDGVADGSDNCPIISNSGQQNSVHPGTPAGDACDDPDGDAVYDSTDNCPDASNTSQTDTDGDRIGDACDPYPHSAKITDGVPRQPVAYPGEIFGTWTGTVQSAGMGIVLSLDPNGKGSIRVDDKMLVSVTHPDSSTAPPRIVDFSNGCSGSVEYRNPIGIGDLMPAGANQVTVDLMDLCGGDKESTSIWLVFDTDSDGLGDDFDICPGTASGLTVDEIGCARVQVDSDLDNWCNPGAPSDGPANCTFTDNCPGNANSGQENLDGDGLGDACDPDIDNDAICNSGGPLPDGTPGTPPGGCAAGGLGVDNCVRNSNTNQADADTDNVGDSCDLCPSTAPAAAVDGNGCANAQVDGDGDSICNPGAPSSGPGNCTGSDNCPTTANTNQQNTDGDGYGNACEPDDDNDGICDSGGPQPDGTPGTIAGGCARGASGADNCPITANANQADVDGDAIGDVCDDSDADGWMDAYDNCRLVYNPTQADSDLDGLGDACDPTPGGSGPGAYGAATTVTLSGHATGANADTTIALSIPSGSPNFSLQATLVPAQATIRPGPGNPGFVAGTDPGLSDVMGVVSSMMTLGLTNNPCNNTLTVNFTLLNATVDISVGNSIAPVPQAGTQSGSGGTLDNQWSDNGSSTTGPGALAPWNGAWTPVRATVEGFPASAGLSASEQADGIPAQVQRYPSYLNTMFSGVQPLARYAGATNVAGTVMTLNEVVFAPGALAAIAPPDPLSEVGASANGYVIVLVLSDPTTVGAPGAITDNCSEFGISSLLYGISRANACGGSTVPPCNTAAGISNPAAGPPTGRPRYQNPGAARTYIWAGFQQSQRDADGDGKENSLDPCPTVADTFNPRTGVGGDADGDGIPDACDFNANGNADSDGDGWQNRGDNCPQNANPSNSDDELNQAYAVAARRGGSKSDNIGDACDSQTGWANGGFSTSLSVIPECIGGTDADNDGWCNTAGGGLPADPNDGTPFRVPEDYNVFMPFGIAHSGSGSPPSRQPVQLCDDGIDNDGDTLIDLLDSGCRPVGLPSHPGYPTCPSTGCPGIDTDGDGFTDEAEIFIGTDALGRCEAGASPARSTDWPIDTLSGGIPNSTDKMNVIDIVSFVAPIRRLDTSPGNPNYDRRFDLAPGPGLFPSWINIADVTAMIAGASGYPPMFNGLRSFNLTTCSAHPIYGD